MQGDRNNSGFDWFVSSLLIGRTPECFGFVNDMRCNNGQCISALDRCDWLATKDCDDGSDEKLCNSTGWHRALFAIDLTDYSHFTQWPRFHAAYLLVFRAQYGQI